MKEGTVLTREQIEAFQTDGILVVNDIFTPTELKSAQDGLHDVLFSRGVNPNNLSETGHKLTNLSSTNGSGGVVDIFYPQFKLDIGTNKRLFKATTELGRWHMTMERGINIIRLEHLIASAVSCTLIGLGTEYRRN